MHIADISSKPVSMALAWDWAMASSASAARGLCTAASAVTRARGSGYSFMTAAVMMPSVPSAPMNRSRRS
ncbi:hypothetical protein D3C81_1538310 [compost metagenome]